MKNSTITKNEGENKMFRFLGILLIISVLFYPSYLIASTLDVDDEDLELSKKSFLISGAPFDDLKKDKKGTLTLCFKEQKPFDHTSLVFEFFKGEEISMTMIHYGREDDCCGFGGKEKIMIDNHRNTLMKSYRAMTTDPISDSKRYLPASFNKYASWILPNDALLKGLTTATEDKENEYSPGNCVKYVKRIMESVELKGIEFGLWTTKPSNLRLLVDGYVKPKYDYKH